MMRRILRLVLAVTMMLGGLADNAQAVKETFLRKVMHGFIFPPNEEAHIRLEADHYGRTLGPHNPCTYRFFVVDKLTGETAGVSQGYNEKKVTLPTNGGRLDMVLDIFLSEGHYAIYYEWIGSLATVGPYYFWDFQVGNPPPLPVPMAIKSFYLTDSWLSIIDNDEPSYLQSKGLIYNNNDIIHVYPRQWHSGLDNAEVTLTLTEAGRLFLNDNPVGESGTEFTFNIDFTESVTLTVVAADDAETKNYTVAVNNPSGNIAGLNGLSLIWDNKAVGITTNHWGSDEFTVTLPADMPGTIGDGEFAFEVSANINASVAIEERPVDCKLWYAGSVNGSYSYSGRLNGFTLSSEPYSVTVTSPDGTVTKEYSIRIVEGTTDPGAAPVWINDDFQYSIRGFAYSDDSYRHPIEDPIPLARLGKVAIQLDQANPLPQGEGLITLRLSETPGSMPCPVTPYPQEWHNNPEIYFEENTYDIPAGRYDVILHTDQEYTLGGITLTDEAPVFYGVNIGTLAGGSVSASKETSTAGKTIEVWVRPNAGHVQQSFSVVDEAGVPLFLTTENGGNFSTYYSFTMPSCDVTIIASFIEMTDDSAIEEAKAVLASNSAGIGIGDTQDTEGMKELIATYINNSITKQTGITVTAADIEIGDIVLPDENSQGSYTYTVKLTKGNASEEVTDTNHIISTEIYYSIITGSYTGGYVSSNPLRSEEGTPVTLEITPYNGYELEAITAHKSGDKNTVVELEGDGDTRTFTMPAHTVTVTATFRLTEAEQAQIDEEAIEAAKDDIEAVEGGTYQITQVTGNTEEEIKSWLRQILGLLFAEKHNIQLRSSAETEIIGDLNITHFTAAQDGTESTPEGTNGSFAFTVTLSRGNTSMETNETSGVIQASPYVAPPYVPVKSISLHVQDELTARISNTGDISTGELTFELSGDHADVFTLSVSSIDDLEVEATMDITLIPDNDLPVGDYRVILTVSGYDLPSESVEFTYTVIDTGIHEPQSDDLQVYVRDGVLYINNLAAGQTWSVYTLSGMLVYQGMAGNKEVKVNLSARGVYIIKAGVTTGKVLY